MPSYGVASFFASLLSIKKSRCKSGSFLLAGAFGLGLAHFMRFGHSFSSARRGRYRFLACRRISPLAVKNAIQGIFYPRARPLMGSLRSSLRSYQQKKAAVKAALFYWRERRGSVLRI